MKNENNSWINGSSSAKNRISSGVVIPASDSSLVVDKSDTVFAIGSCFARNIEEKLLQNGVEVLSSSPGITEFRDSVRPAGYLNRYTLPSIYQSLNNSFDEVIESQFIKVGDDLYFDPEIRAKANNLSLNDVIARRKLVNDYFRKAFDADVVILTLGLTESWFDKHNEMYLAETVSPRLRKKYNDRFLFENLDYSKNLSFLKNIIELLSEKGKKDQKIIITVSPVPLGRTFTSNDVIVANTYSKSTLRTVAHDVRLMFDSVYYFPSFESVMYSDRTFSYKEDQLHVSDEIVGLIISKFISRHIHGDFSDSPNEKTVRTTVSGYERNLNDLPLIVPSSQSKVFVTGLSRSGTSAFVKLLNTHSKIAIGLERYKDLLFKKNIIEINSFNTKRFFQFLEGDTNIRRHNKEFDDFYKSLEGKFDDCQVVGDKIPDATSRIEQFSGVFPNSTIIWLNRNPIDIASSWQKRADDDQDSWPEGKGVKQAIESYIKQTKLLLSLLKRPRYSHRLVIVDYDKFFSSFDTCEKLLKRLKLSNEQVFSDAYIKFSNHYRGLSSNKTSNFNDVAEISEVLESALSNYKLLKEYYL